jgi:hypothetical protein
MAVIIMVAVGIIDAQLHAMHAISAAEHSQQLDTAQNGVYRTKL